MSDPQDEPQIAAETLASVPTPNGGFLTGTAQGVTDEDGYTSVLVDGPPDTPEDEDSETSPSNAPMPMQTLVRGLSAQERGVVITAPSGTGYVMPYSNGLLAAASIPGGEPDVPIVSTAAVAITDLEVTAEVLWPGHLIEITVNVELESGGALNTMTGRVIAEDEDGNTREVGRWMRDNQLGLNQTVQRGIPVVDWDPEPGIWIYRPTVQASVLGWSIILSPGTTPETAASMTVYDKGPLPTSAARV